MHSSQKRWPQVVEAGLTISSKHMEHFHMSSSPLAPPPPFPPLPPPPCDCPPLREAVANGARAAAAAPAPSSTVTFMLSPLKSITPRVLAGGWLGLRRDAAGADAPAGAERLAPRPLGALGSVSDSSSESSKSITSSLPPAAPVPAAAAASAGVSSSPVRSVRSTDAGMLQY